MKIISIGDSHSQIFDSGQNYPVFGTWLDNQLNDRFLVKWLGPVTLHRICRDGFKSFNVFDSFYKNQKVILSFGEIDSRQHIHNHSHEKGIDYRKVIDDLISRFENRLIEIDYKRFDIYLLNLVPPVKKSDCLEGEYIEVDEYYRKKYTSYINERYYELSIKMEIEYINQYDVFLGSDGFIDKNSFDGLIHGVKTEKIEKMIKNKFKL